MRRRPSNRTSLGAGAVRLCAAALLLAAATARGEQQADAVCPLSADAPAADVILRLAGALAVSNGCPDRDLELWLRRTSEGRWLPEALGFSAFFSRGRLTHGGSLADHEGVVVEWQEDGDEVHLVVDLKINGGAAGGAASARYTIDSRRAAGRFAGGYTGVVLQRTPASGAAPGGARVGGGVTGESRDRLWPALLKGRAPARRGEHPRLFFRADRIEDLRAKAQSPEGQAMLSHLRKALGLDSAGAAASRAFTLWDGAGYGCLYRITGEKSFADMGRASVERAMAGKPDRDAAFAFGWVTPGGLARAGVSCAAVAAAYDLCYEGWDPGFRDGVAQAIQRLLVCTNAGAEAWGRDLSHGDGAGRPDPRSADYGAWVGGAGLAAIAIAGDAGVGDAAVRRAHALFLQRAKRALGAAVSPRGFFHGGTQAGSAWANAGMTWYFQALRNALGQELAGACDAGRWFLPRLMFEAGCGDGLPAPDGIARSALARNGDFGYGFGLCPEKYKPALLQAYAAAAGRRAVEPYDAGAYPQQAALAFVNWPVGLSAGDPYDVLGPALWDAEADTGIVRNGWRGDGDVIVTRRGTAGVVCALGRRAPFDAPPMGSVTDARREADGLLCVTMAAGAGATNAVTALAIDTSGLCGAPVLVAAARPRAAGEAPALGQARLEDGKQARVAAGDAVYVLVAMGAAGTVLAEAAGGGAATAVAVGRRVLAFDGAGIVTRTR